jgi:hypothetical protein
VLVAGEVDDVVDLADGVQVPDERPGRVDLAVSARGGAAVDVDDVVVARQQEEGLGLEADRIEGDEEGEDLVDPALNLTALRSCCNEEHITWRSTVASDLQKRRSAQR